MSHFKLNSFFQTLHFSVNILAGLNVALNSPVN